MTFTKEELRLIQTVLDAVPFKGIDSVKLVFSINNKIEEVLKDDGDK